MNIASALLVLAIVPLTAAAASDHQHHVAAPAAAQAPRQGSADAQWVDGLVKKVDKTAGKVTLAHGPLANLGMDMAMTMAFRVKDTAWLEQMKVGDKIRFVADQVDGVLTLVKFEQVR